MTGRRRALVLGGSGAVGGAVVAALAARDVDAAGHERRDDGAPHGPAAAQHQRAPLRRHVSSSR